MSAQSGVMLVDCSLSSSTIEPGQSVTVEATVVSENTVYDVEYEIQLLIDGVVETVESGTLAPEESTDYSQDLDASGAGEYLIEFEVSEETIVMELVSSYDASNVGVEDGEVVEEIPDPVGGIAATLN